MALFLRRGAPSPSASRRTGRWRRGTQVCLALLALRRLGDTWTTTGAPRPRVVPLAAQLASSVKDVEQVQYAVGECVRALSPTDHRWHDAHVLSVGRSGRLTLRWEGAADAEDGAEVDPILVRKLSVEYGAGDDVMAVSPEDGRWYPAVVVAGPTADRGFTVRWDDPTAEPGTADVDLAGLRRVRVFRDYRVGDCVEALCPDGGGMAPGRVAEAKPDGSFSVRWDDPVAGEVDDVWPKHMRKYPFPLEALKVGQMHRGSRTLVYFSPTDEASVDVGCLAEGYVDLARSGDWDTLPGTFLGTVERAVLPGPGRIYIQQDSGDAVVLGQAACWKAFGFKALPDVGTRVMYEVQRKSRTGQLRALNVRPGPALGERQRDEGETPITVASPASSLAESGSQETDDVASAAGVSIGTEVDVMIVHCGGNRRFVASLAEAAEGELDVSRFLDIPSDQWLNGTVVQGSDDYLVVMVRTEDGARAIGSLRDPKIGSAAEAWRNVQPGQEVRVRVVIVDTAQETMLLSALPDDVAAFEAVPMIRTLSAQVMFQTANWVVVLAKAPSGRFAYGRIRRAAFKTDPVRMNSNVQVRVTSCEDGKLSLQLVRKGPASDFLSQMAGL